MDCAHCRLAQDETAPLECWLCALVRARSVEAKRELGHAMLDDWTQSLRAARALGLDVEIES
jgi:hypothetical protein